MRGPHNLGAGRCDAAPCTTRDSPCLDRMQPYSTPPAAIALTTSGHGLNIIALDLFTGKSALEKILRLICGLIVCECSGLKNSILGYAVGSVASC